MKTSSKIARETPWLQVDAAGGGATHGARSRGRLAFDASASGAIHRGRDLCSRYRLLAALATGLLLASATGCASTKSDTAAPAKPAREAAPEQAAPEAPATSQERLYGAILEEARARGWAIATASERFFTVVTDYEAVSARLRKRRIMRVVVLPRGGALNVTIEYQRDVGPEGAPRWALLESDAIRERAASEELELARAIERRFHQR